MNVPGSYPEIENYSELDVMIGGFFNNDVSRKSKIEKMELKTITATASV